MYESSVLEFDPNSALYRTDTTIEGINGGTVTGSGVTLTIARTQATPSSVNLNDLIELVTEIVPSSPFGRRTYIRLKKEIDRDVSFKYLFRSSEFFIDTLCSYYWLLTIGYNCEKNGKLS